MKNVKKKIVSGMCGLGLLLGASGMVGSACADEFDQIKKDGFVIQLNPLSFRSEQFYTVEIWSEKNKEKDPGYPYDGDSDITYRFYPPESSYREWWNIEDYDKNGDGWLKTVNKWKKKEDGSVESSPGTGSVLSDTSYENVPGSPKGLLTKQSMVDVDIDFDEGEEYAEGEFTNKKDALEWADNMVEIFKSKDYERYK